MSLQVAATQVEAPQWDLEGAVGRVVEVKPVTWTTRDVLLYAVGLGAGRDDLQLVYEKHPKFTTFPTYAACLKFKETHIDIFPFKDPIPQVPGLPLFDPRTILHGGEGIKVLKPLPTASGPGWTQTTRITGVHEKAKGFVLDSEFTISDPNGVPYAKIFSNTFYVRGKANGVPFSKALPGVGLLQPVGKVEKGRAPDFVQQETLSESAAIVYRLSGDYNPHCIDPAVGVKAGLKGAVLQGLATWGISARLITEVLAGGNPEALKAISARFSSPVHPGDSLQVNLWETGVILEDGSKEFTFETVNLTTGKLALGGGVTHVIIDTKPKL